jgi:hypothetical protein
MLASFINRNNVDTNPKSYFPSIIRQLVDHHPGSEVVLTIHNTLKKKQSLADDISANQAMRLFVAVVEVAGKLDPNRPVHRHRRIR